MIYLFVVSILLIVLLAWEKYQNRQEKNRLINAILSKNINDFSQLERVGKEKKKSSEAVSSDKYIDLSEMTDEEHTQVVEQEREDLGLNG